MRETGYYIDLEAVSLEKLKEQLKSARLLPSQKILGEAVGERIACLQQHGIENLMQLQAALKSKSDNQLLSEATGLSVEYLTILRREVYSNQPKPIALKDFPDVDPDVVQKLLQLGVKNTFQLFPKVLSPNDRIAFSKQHLIDLDALLELTKLTDLARLKWVGPKFARLLFESGYDTVEKVAISNYEELYATIMRVNKAKNIYAGRLGLEDMKQWVKFAVQDVPRVIQY
jgi:hypothetical protein